MSPALAGRFSTTAPPGKPKKLILLQTVHEKEGKAINKKLRNSLLTQGYGDSGSYLNKASHTNFFLFSGVYKSYVYTTL